MTEPALTPPAKRRKRFGLSLRVLMVLVLLLGGGMGWYAYRARVQREAVAAIEAAGGKVYYDWEWNGDQAAPPTAKPRWPKWLMDRVGPDYLGNVVAVCFFGSDQNRADDNILIPISQLAFLQHLDFDDGTLTTSLDSMSRVTDKGLFHLRGLRQLQNLFLDGMNISGAGLAHLKEIRSLKRLSVRYIPLKDDDMICLADLTQLEALHFGSEHVTDAGFQRLRNLTSLKVLGIDCPRISSAGLDALRTMVRLQELFIFNSTIDELQPITRLPELRKLYLYRSIGCQLSSTPDVERLPLRTTDLGPLKKLQDLVLTGCEFDDQELNFLMNFTELRDLNLSHTNSTDRSIANLFVLKNLRSIILCRTDITDASLATISRLPSVSDVFLSFTNLTDAGLPSLYSLNKCRIIDVFATGVTAVGAQELIRKLPSVEIHHESLLSPPSQVPASPTP
jgi:internalin A